MKKIGDLTLNDGKGLMDNEGLCDSLLLDLNNLTKVLMTGQYIQFCAMISSMAQRVANLKKGITNDMQSMQEKVEDLKRLNNHLAEQVAKLQAEKDGAENGEN